MQSNKNSRIAAMTHRSFDSMAAIFAWMMTIAEITNIKGKTFLEIGTGQFINHPVCALVCGAKRAVTYDVKNKLVDNYRESLNYTVMANRLLSPFDGNSALKKRLNKIHHLADMVEIVFGLPKERFDVIFSYSTLEHVPEKEIPSLIRYIKKYSKKSVHYIDLDDNFRGNKLNAGDWLFLTRCGHIADDKTYGIFMT